MQNGTKIVVPKMQFFKTLINKHAINSIAVEKGKTEYQILLPNSLEILTIVQSSDSSCDTYTFYNKTEKQLKTCMLLNKHKVSIAELLKLYPSFLQCCILMADGSRAIIEINLPEEHVIIHCKLIKNTLTLHGKMPLNLPVTENSELKKYIPNLTTLTILPVYEAPYFSP